MNKKELVLEIAKDILVAAMAKDSQANLDLGLRPGKAQIDILGEQLELLSKKVESVLDGLKD